jgi:hypothetical protein
MAHKGEETLIAEIEKAKSLVSVGGFYTHYKNPDKQYKVTEIAILEATDELCVIYQAQYGEKLTFARPLASWLETIKWQNNLVPRFTKTKS